MISMTDSLLISLPCISLQSTEVIIEQFCDMDAIPVNRIFPKFRSLSRVVEVRDQRICIKESIYNIRGYVAPK